MRNLLALLLFVPSLCLAQVPDYVPADGLVAYYSLDEGSLGDSGLTPSQTADWTTNRNGETNKASWFDGNQEYVTTGLNYQDFTISAWVLPDGANSNLDNCHGIVSQNADNCNALVFMATCNIPLAANFQVREQDDCAAEQVSTSLEHDMWQHLVFVREGGQIQSYRNGILEQSGPGTSTALSPEVPLRIGSMPYGGLFRGFEGGIDDIGIWNRALSEQEIAQLYEAGSLTFGCTDPIACNYDAAAEGDDGSCVYPPSVHLGDDIYTCAPSVVLTSTEGSSYLWNTGDTSQTIQVFDSGVYTVEVAEEVDIETEESISFLEGVEDRVIIPHIAEYDIMTSGYSIALDIKLNSFETTNSGISDYIVFKLDESFGVGNNAMGFDIAISGGLPIVHFRLFDRLQSNLNYLVAIPQDSMALGEWHHMAFTIDESATRAYLNGEEVDAIETPSCFNIGNGSAPIVLGQSLEGASGFFSEFNGNIDNLQLFSRALDPMEVLSVASCPVSQLNSVDLLGYWNMEDGQDGAISDLSEFGNAAQVMNASLTSDTPSRSCSSYCAASDSVQVTILPCDNLTYLCGAGTVWDSASAQCISIADTIFIEPIACAPSCGEGTVWDPVNEECIIAIPADLNYDGCVTVNDLLVLLAVHGTCPPYPEWPDEPTDTTWTCGAPLTYWDYDYATVLIGDQCWFAENLRTMSYADGTEIPEVTDNEDWTDLTTGAHCSYASDPGNVAVYGLLYNWFAVQDIHGLCPSGWHVPTDGEWTGLENQIGSQGFSGNEGTALKSTSGWSNNGNGTDQFGFTGLPGGDRWYLNGSYFSAGTSGAWWSSSSAPPSAWRRRLFDIQSHVDRAVSDDLRNGFSVRCLKD